MNAVAARYILVCLAATYCVYSYLSQKKSIIALNAIKDDCYHQNIITDMADAEDQASIIIVKILKAEEDEEAERNRIEAAKEVSQIIDDFDISQPEIPCGSKHCFIPSKSFEGVGYLIGQSALSTLQIAYEFGEHLRERYGIPNILLEPPQYIGRDSNVSLVSQQINQKSYGWHHNKHEKAQFRRSQNFTIQKSRTLPFDDGNRTFFVKCGGSDRIDLTRSMWEDQRGGGGWLSLRRGSIERKESFLRQFQESIDQVSLIMKNEPLFVYDMQVLVTTEGQIHHMDIDRINEGWRHREEDPGRFRDKIKRTRKKCLEFLYEMKHDVVLGITNTTHR